MGTLNYTTTVTVAKSLTEMQTMLAEHGASAVSVLYAQRKPAGLTFALPTPHGDRHFTLPVDVDAVHRLLVEQDKSKKLAAASHRKRGYYSTPEQAERVAWRIAKDWLEAQLAIVEAQMASLDQVMLPYLHVDGAKTLYAAYREREAALEITTGVNS